MRLDISVSIILIPKDTEKVSFFIRKKKADRLPKRQTTRNQTEIWIVKCVYILYNMY